RGVPDGGGRPDRGTAASAQTDILARARAGRRRARARVAGAARLSAALGQPGRSALAIPADRGAHARAGGDPLPGPPGTPLAPTTASLSGHRPMNGTDKHRRYSDAVVPLVAELLGASVEEQPYRAKGARAYVLRLSNRTFGLDVVLTLWPGLGRADARVGDVFGIVKDVGRVTLEPGVE